MHILISFNIIFGSKMSLGNVVWIEILIYMKVRNINVNNFRKQNTVLSNFLCEKIFLLCQEEAINNGGSWRIW